MTITLAPCPPEQIPELEPVLDHRDDEDFIAKLLESLEKANSRAVAQPGGLDPALYTALPLAGMDGWPTTLDAWVQYLVLYSRWIPQQSSDPAWLDPTSDIGEHQEVYDRLCWFHWLIDQPLDSGGVLQDIPWFADFLVDWANAWGNFLDTPESFNDEILDSFRELSPKYRIEDSMIPDEKNPGALRSNNASGWLTFNQFFARELNPGLRPISYPDYNEVITAPADCTFKACYDIDENGIIQPPITLKGTHTYASVQQLLDKSKYADAFNGGYFVHLFLGPYSYHRFHTPVAGMVKECYPLAGQVYLAVSLSEGQFDAADSATDGYEFLQARGILTIDTAGSPAGDVGVVATIPVGMCQVSGVNMIHEEGTACAKGDEFGYFTFGGSDIILLFQKGADPRYNPAYVPGTHFYSLYGTEVARVSTKG